MSVAPASPWIKDGIAHCRLVFTSPAVADLASRIDAAYRPLEAARLEGGMFAASRLVATGQRFLPTASSLTVGAVLSDEEIRAIVAGVAAGPAGEWIRTELGQRIACDLDQAWVRRQYAPRNYPPLHAPHGWHQDGGLGFNYLAHPDDNFPHDAMLLMVTCWIALVPCGSEAPGLELVTRRFDSLLAPAELAEARVRVRFAPDEFRQPVMEAGDALLFRGDILHRTHVTPAMAKDRTSIELRFFPMDRLPARLKTDRFVSMD